MKYVYIEIKLKSHLKGVTSLGWRPPLLNLEGAIWWESNCLKFTIFHPFVRLIGLFII